MTKQEVIDRTISLIESTINNLPLFEKAGPEYKWLLHQ